MAATGSARGGEARLWYYAAAASKGGFVFGYDNSVVDGAVDAIGGTFGAGPGAVGVGAAFSGRIADHVGRIRGMWPAAGLYVLGAAGAASAPSPAVL
ncbi:hypothetical protein ACQEU5_03950 [Marinactinospora thermotolerans]|uniref:Uncharacterized protein n=1 Tax=Marinactinospora thermotolerans DSM 45154 TaxID=1122192 RepID=A0A1T4Q7P2_9ACTN|nr:hypothetical protein SAMN02745673_02082 [Marinactinospora thermotolerans DSM 45154]